MLLNQHKYKDNNMTENKYLEKIAVSKEWISKMLSGPALDNRSLEDLGNFQRSIHNRELGHRLQAEFYNSVGDTSRNQTHLNRASKYYHADQTVNNNFVKGLKEAYNQDAPLNEGSRLFKPKEPDLKFF